LIALHNASNQSRPTESNAGTELIASTRDQYRTLTTTKRRYVDSIPGNTEAENSTLILGTHESIDANRPDESDSSSSIIVDEDSEEDSSADEFGTPDNPKMSPQNRAELEQVIFAGKINTTLKYKQEWEAAKAAEDHYVKEHRINKYAWDMAAGGVNQVTSFGVAGVTATLTGNIWLFPVVAMLTSDLIGDRLAQVVRRSTIVANGSKQHFENQRRVARAIGDLIEYCAGKPRKKKFSVPVVNPQTGKTEVEKMTACQAIKHAGCCAGLSAWGQNLLVRGLPFLWFSAIYGPRDYYLNYRCDDIFFPNATAMHQANFSTPNGCPDPEIIDPVALRWGMVLIGGMIAGALTNVTGQLIGSLLPHEERTNYSYDTFKKEVLYKESAKIDTKAYLDWLGQAEVQDTNEVKMAQTLMRIFDKELRVARSKSSVRTTYFGELDMATQKHRDETMITPEFGGKRVELTMSMLGKFLTLLSYAYFASHFNVRTSEEQDKIMGLILIPLSLIIIGGYAFRDDARLVGLAPYGLAKGAYRACRKGRIDPSESDETDTRDKPSITVEIPGVVGEDDDESSHPPTSPSIAHSSGRSEKVTSVSDTPVPQRQNTVRDSILIPEPSESDSSEVV
jgi:hypothetical protein